MKSAIITGASSGIGLEITRVLLDQNYKVYGFGRDFSTAGIYHEYFIPKILDLMDTKTLTQTIKTILLQEEIHILVNSAGVGFFGPHETLNPDKIHQMVVLNLEVPLLLTQLTMRELKKNQGHIINISSVTASKSNTHGCAYGATKAGLTSFSHSLFDEVRKYGVKVTTLHPDITKTQFYRNADFCEGEENDTYLNASEIAEAILFILNQRKGLVISDLTIKPQRHRIRRK